MDVTYTGMLDPLLALAKLAVYEPVFRLTACPAIMPFSVALLKFRLAAVDPL